MDKNTLSIATICWARNEEEETVLRKSLTQLAQLNIPVFITDGGSIESFVTFLQSMPQFTVCNAVKGLWPQAKTSLMNAYESSSAFIFYTEPDKFDLFTQALPQVLTNVSLQDKTGVHLLSRSQNAFQSFPPFQQMTETTINHCCAEIISRNVDYTYGPFFINRNIIPHLHDLPQNIGWGWRPYAFVTAHKKGYSVECFEGDFFCPSDQRADDAPERIYRMKQLAQNMEGITLASTT